MSSMRAQTDVAHHDASRREEVPAPSERTGLASMEVADYLRIIRRRLWVVLSIPALAVAVAATLILGRPTEHAATATVSAGSIISNAPGDTYATANGAQQFVADFVAAISVPPVIDAVAELTDASPDEIRGNVTATPIGESTLIEIRYVTTEPSKAGPVVHALALETMRFLFRPTTLAGPSELDGEAGDGSLPTERLELMLAQEETVSVGPTQIEPRGPDLVRGVQVALGSGLLLGLLVVILLEILPFRRNARQGSPERARPSRPVGLSPVGEHEQHVTSATDIADGRVRAAGPLARIGDVRGGRAPQTTRERGPAAGREPRSEEDRPAERTPDEPKVGPPPRGGPSEDPEPVAGTRKARKPRATKTRPSASSKPKTKGSPHASSPEQARRGAASPSEADVVEPDPRGDAPPTDGQTRDGPEPPNTRKRRPSRADARRAAHGDDRPPGGPTREPETEALDAPGSPVDPGAAGATRAVEEHPTDHS